MPNDPNSEESRFTICEESQRTKRAGPLLLFASASRLVALTKRYITRLTYRAQADATSRACRRATSTICLTGCLYGGPAHVTFLSQ